MHALLSKIRPHNHRSLLPQDSAENGVAAILQLSWTCAGTRTIHRPVGKVGYERCVRTPRSF